MEDTKEVIEDEETPEGEVIPDSTCFAPLVRKQGEKARWRMREVCVCVFVLFINRSGLNDTQ